MNANCKAQHAKFAGWLILSAQAAVVKRTGRVVVASFCVANFSPLIRGRSKRGCPKKKFSTPSIPCFIRRGIPSNTKLSHYRARRIVFSISLVGARFSAPSYPRRIKQGAMNRAPTNVELSTLNQLQSPLYWQLKSELNVFWPGLNSNIQASSV